jgi:hypothetical protein
LQAQQQEMKFSASAAAAAAAASVKFSFFCKLLPTLKFEVTHEIFYYVNWFTYTTNK